MIVAGIESLGMELLLAPSQCALIASSSLTLNVSVVLGRLVLSTTLMVSSVPHVYNALQPSVLICYTDLRVSNEPKYPLLSGGLN